MDKIRVLVADDHPTFRQGLGHFLSREKDIEVVGEAADGQECLKLCTQLLPDVAITNISMPKINGIEAARQIKQAFPSTSILMLSDSQNETVLFASIRAGASGFLVKSAPIPDLIRAVRMVHSGKAVFDLTAMQSVLKYSLKTNKDLNEIPELHSRELQILQGVSAGLSNRLIGESLGIGPRTVQTHMSHIFRKLKTHSRTQAVIYALKLGIISQGSAQKESTPAKGAKTRRAV
jgi:DNA-binding NarL/FixJ family response regulator